MPRRSLWCRTISTLTNQHRCTRLFRQTRQDVLSSGSNGIIRQSTEVGSIWRNLAVLLSQCLDRRIPDKRILIHQVAAWEADRNAHHAKADRQFTTDDARIKLKHLYPTFWMTRATS